MVTVSTDIHNPVRIETTRFGAMDVDASMLFTFPEGLVGLPDVRRFAVLDDTAGPLQWLQSLDDPRLALVIVDPLLMDAAYRVRVSRNELAPIDLHDAADGRVCVILSIPRDPAQMTANLQGPLVFNVAGQLAKQLVLNEYSTRHRVIA